MKLKVLLTVLLLGVALTGCSPNEFLRDTMNRIAPDEDEALAKEFVIAIRSKDFERVKGQLDPQFVKSGIESELLLLSKILTQDEPLSVELVGCNVFSTPEKRRSHLTYQYQFPNAWILVAIIIDTVGENKRIFGINVNPISKSLGELNAFTFTGKGAQHYVLLFFAIIIPFFIVWTIVLCARTKIRKKWLWIIFALVGITKLNLNWTTGQIEFQPVAFLIPGSGAAKMGLYAPWILTVSFPLGAILFLSKRRKLLANTLEKGEHSEPEDRQVYSADATGASAEKPSS